MPAAVAIPLIVAAASTSASVYGAHKAASANEKASETEGKSAADALAFEKQRLALLDAQRQPYVNFGTGALGTYADLLGLQNPMTAVKTGPVNPNIPTGITGPYPNQPNTNFDPSQPQSSTLMVGGAGRPDAAVGGTANPGTPGSPVTSGWALMESPDGERKAIPSGLVGYWTAKGAKVVGGAPAGTMSNVAMNTMLKATGNS